MNRFVQLMFWLACMGDAVLSLLPGAYLPPGFDGWDKVQHALAFLLLGGLVLVEYANASKVWDWVC